MQDALLLSARPGIIQFSLGLPSPDLFPVEVVTAAFADLLSRGSSPLQYGPPTLTLKSHIVSLMRTRGVECTERQIFLTNGAQQAVYLIVGILLEQGREVIAEELCYPGFQQIIGFYKPEILTVPSDRQSGMDVERVEWYLERGARPAFIYAIADGHNPLGTTLSDEKRQRLITLCCRYSVPIIEEDPYGFLSYREGAMPPLKARQADLVFYVGSFSKILAPSLRIGWLVVPEKYIPYLAILKESLDIDTATLSQHLAARMLDSGFLSQHLARLCSAYKCHRDTMLAGLSACFPDGSQWSTPDSGVFIWVQLPEAFDATHLLKTAVDGYGVAFMPGSAFCIRRNDTTAHSSLRMNFSYPSTDLIKEGVLRLGAMFAATTLGRTNGLNQNREHIANPWAG
jgi:2-aminoadipate transaminase